MATREARRASARALLAETAAALFAARGYDGVAVIDVARAAGVAEQTVYNHFPTKHSLVLDSAEEISTRFAERVRTRPVGTSPAAALAPMLMADLDRIDSAPRTRAGRGTFAAQCLLSPALRRFALEFREQQAAVLAAVLAVTDPSIAPLTARAHAAALVHLAQAVADDVGAHIIADTGGGPADVSRPRPLPDLLRDYAGALSDLDRSFRHLVSGGTA